MARVHGRWGHYVRPGVSDPVYNGSFWRYNEDGAASISGNSSEKKRKKRKQRPSTGKELSTSSLVVYDVNGKVLYHCGKKKSIDAWPRIINTFPANSFMRSGNEVRLLQELSTLGFRSAVEFGQFCAGKVDKPSEAGGKETVDNSIPSFKGGHLDKRETRILDRTYRIHGGDPNWKGWDSAIRGRSKPLLFSEARRLGIDMPDDERWTREEVKVFTAHWKTLSPSNAQWKKLLPRKSPEGIAYAYIQQGLPPRAAKTDATEHPSDNKPYVRKREWHRVEDDALRRQFAIGETDMHLIKRVIPYRANADIRLRIKELGLVGPNSKSGDENKDAERAAKRNEWATEMVVAYYEVYGASWPQWRRILPWMGADDIAALASSIDADDPWSDEDREYFLASEENGWTLTELNELIRLSPLLDSNDSEAWSSFLPDIGDGERGEMQELLNIPTKDKVDELARAAAGLE